jgi:serine/threonine-protein kinase SRPK3
MESLSKNQKKNLKKKLRKEKLKCHDISDVQCSPAKIAKPIQEILGLRKDGLDMRCPKDLQLPLRIKIADLGNACWKHHHFST